MNVCAECDVKNCSECSLANWHPDYGAEKPKRSERYKKLDFIVQSLLVALEHLRVDVYTYQRDGYKDLLMVVSSQMEIIEKSLIACKKLMQEEAEK